MYIYIYIHTHIYIYMYIYIYIVICACVCVCVYACSLQLLAGGHTAERGGQSEDGEDDRRGGERAALGSLGLRRDRRLVALFLGAHQVREPTRGGTA